MYGKTAEMVRDLKGLRLTPDAALGDAPQLDVLHIPGGFGQEALMEDEAVLSWIRTQAAGAHSVFSVCTGALICGAAGLLKGRRATTHWASFHLLPYFGAIQVNERVVVDGNWVFAAGVSAGIDGALRLAGELRGEAAAQSIQLHMVYAPEPPFDAGSPETAPPAILEAARKGVAGITEQRHTTARRIADRLGIIVPAQRRHGAGRRTGQPRNSSAQAPKPPSIVCIAPVTKLASGPTSQITIPATSSGRPCRLMARAACWMSFIGPSAGFRSVSMGPGCTTFTVIPRGPKSRASPRAMPYSADLLIA